MQGPLLNESFQLTCIPESVSSNATLSFKLTEEASVILKIMNSAEEIVRVLLNEQLAAGGYSIPFNASHLPPGNYTARMMIGTSTEVSIRNTFFRVSKAAFS